MPTLLSDLFVAEFPRRYIHDRIILSMVSAADPCNSSGYNYFWWCVNAFYLLEVPPAVKGRAFASCSYLQMANRPTAEGGIQAASHLSDSLKQKGHLYTWFWLSCQEFCNQWEQELKKSCAYKLLVQRAWGLFLTCSHFYVLGKSVQDRYKIIIFISTFVLKYVCLYSCWGHSHFPYSMFPSLWCVKEEGTTHICCGGQIILHSHKWILVYF